MDGVGSLDLKQEANKIAKIERMCFCVDCVMFSCEFVHLLQLRGLPFPVRFPSFLY